VAYAIPLKLRKVGKSRRSQLPRISITPSKPPRLCRDRSGRSPGRVQALFKIKPLIKMHVVAGAVINLAQENMETRRKHDFSASLTIRAARVALEPQSRSPLVQLPSGSVPKRKKVDGVNHAHLVLVPAGTGQGAQETKLVSSADAVRSLHD
jgi:hypothetical protein